MDLDRQHDELDRLIAGFDEFVLRLYIGSQQLTADEKRLIVEQIDTELRAVRERWNRARQASLAWLVSISLRE